MVGRQALNIGEAFSQAMKTWEDGDGAEARRLARRIVEAKPEFGGAHYLLGVIALAGIIMRNSVILVDQIDQDRKSVV